jgi:hypothetical protein
MRKILCAFVSLVALGALLLVSGWEAKPAPDQPVEYAVWSPYWTVQSGFTSTMEIKNNRAKETLRVVVSLYFAGGEEYHLDPISLGPRQTIVMNLNRVVESLPVSVAERAAKEGTAEVKFGGPNNAALMGSISVTNPEQGIAWNFRLYPVKLTLAVTPLRGLFWFHDEGTDGFVAVQNASEEFITVLPRFQIASAYYSLAPISLGSGQGFKLELRKELRKLGLGEAMAGGIEFSYQGPPDAVKAHGVLFNNRGFSAEIDFARSDSSPEPQVLALRTPRFAIGNADPALGLPAPTTFEPVLALHNFSTQGLAVTLSVGYRAGGIVKEVQLSISLPASNTRILSLRPYLEGVVPPDAHWASLEVSYRDRQNSLSGALVSVSQDGEHSIRSVLNGVQGSGSEGWLWRADAEYNTLLGLMNTDTEEARVRVSLDYYAGGVRHSYELPERTIPGRGSDLVDVGQIIASGIADSDGDIIPASVSFGGYSVRKIGRRIHTTLITEALVFNRRTKNFLTFYNTCCGPRNVQVVPSQIVGPFGITTQVDVEGTDSCSGAPVIVTGSSTFSSSNTPVATVGTTTGTVSLVAPGAATIHTHLDYFQGPEYINGHCIPNSLDQDTPTTVTPGACTATLTGTGGDGTKNCPAQVQVFDNYNVVDYSSACQFSCIPVGFDSTFTPSNCSSITGGVVGTTTRTLQSTESGTFAFTDCNFHTLQIQTRVINAQGVTTTYNGGSIGLKCNSTPKGSPCP